MTDYLEELLEAWAEERGDEETPEFPQLRWGEARQLLSGERRRDTEAEKRRADEGGEAYERQAAMSSGAEAAKKIFFPTGRAKLFWKRDEGRGI